MFVRKVVLGMGGVVRGLAEFQIPFNDPSSLGCIAPYISSLQCWLLNTPPHPGNCFWGRGTIHSNLLFHFISFNPRFRCGLTEEQITLAR